MKLLVTGAGGLLGRDLASVARNRSYAVSALARAELDVTDPAAVDRAISSLAPDVVVQCAGFTNVDASEEHADLAMALNRDATGRVAAACASVGSRFVYVSSDYVFDGARDRPYPTGAPTAPLSAYGRSKEAGERATLAASDDAMIVRTSWLYGSARPTFVTSMIARAADGERLTVVDDQIGGPTWSLNVAEALLDLVERGVRGVWHVADRGACSWAELAREALRLVGLDTEVVGVSAEAWGAPAARPRYSVLDTTETEEALGRSLPAWRDSLERFLADVPVKERRQA